MQETFQGEPQLPQPKVANKHKPAVGRHPWLQTGASRHGHEGGTVCSGSLYTRG